MSDGDDNPIRLNSLLIYMPSSTANVQLQIMIMMMMMIIIIITIIIRPSSSSINGSSCSCSFGKTYYLNIDIIYVEFVRQNVKISR
jgi:hypothetical protein